MFVQECGRKKRQNIEWQRALTFVLAEGLESASKSSVKTLSDRKCIRNNLTKYSHSFKYSQISYSTLCKAIIRLANAHTNLNQMLTAVKWTEKQSEELSLCLSHQLQSPFYPIKSLMRWVIESLLLHHPVTADINLISYTVLCTLLLNHFQQGSIKWNMVSNHINRLNRENRLRQKNCQWQKNYVFCSLALETIIQNSLSGASHLL